MVMSHERRHPLTRRQRVLSALLAVVLVALGGLGAFFAHASLSVSTVIEHANEINACRQAFKADVDDANAVLVDLFQDGLAASTAGDEAKLARLQTEVLPDRIVRDKADNAYHAAIAESVARPSEFRKTCAAALHK